MIDLIFAPLENSNDARGSDAHSAEESKGRTVEESPGSDQTANRGKQGQVTSEGKGEREGEVDDRGIRLSSISPTSQMPSDRGLTLDLASTMEYRQSSERDYLFWDAVAARKNKSKTKRSRKYTSAQNREGQFSISDEMGRSNDSDSGSFPKVSSSQIPDLGPIPLGKK